MKIFLLILLLIVVVLYANNRALSLRIERQFPATGSFITVNGVKLHYTDHPAGPNSDLETMVFIHGASGNLRDLEVPLAEQLEGRGRMIFLDRPGHGHSERGDAVDIHLPWGQAKLVSALLQKLGIEKAIIIGHSYGAAVAAAFAVQHPEQTAGLVFLAPATHPWPGAGVSWHYDVTNIPVLGYLFSTLIAVPGGYLQFENGVKGVFAPEPMPENYLEKTGDMLLLRPDVFRNNAKDVGSLYSATVEISPRYVEINRPTSIITGDSDDVVLANIHSIGLERDIKGSKLIWLKGVGHAPAWSAPEVVIREIERVSGEAALSR